MIFQIHKDHGKHVAYSPQEAEANEKNGWKTVSEEEFYVGITKIDEKRAGTNSDEEYAGIENVKKNAIDQELIDAHIAKFGKKPHPNAKPETIIEKLNADSE